MYDTDWVWGDSKGWIKDLRKIHWRECKVAKKLPVLEMGEWRKVCPVCKCRVEEKEGMYECRVCKVKMRDSCEEAMKMLNIKY